MRSVRHEVIMKIKADLIRRAAEVNDTITEVARFARQIPEVQHVSIGRAANGTSAMMIVVVPDEDALERYNTHPAHEKMVELANLISDDFIVQDYIVIK